LDRYPYRRKVIYVQQDIWYVDFCLHHMLNIESNYVLEVHADITSEKVYPDST
jgi:hypothetical protein